MSYFKIIPLTTFEFENNTFIVKDITKRSKFITEISPYTGLYNLYEIRDGDTIQSIAANVYGSATLHWVIAIFNEIHNLYFEWPLDQVNLEKYVAEKYGSAANSIRHWEYNNNIVGVYSEFTTAEDWVSPSNPMVENSLECVPMTFYDYEASLNDSKRMIKILHPSLISDFIQQFRKSFNE